MNTVLGFSGFPYCALETAIIYATRSQPNKNDPAKVGPNLGGKYEQIFTLQKEKAEKMLGLLRHSALPGWTSAHFI